MPNSFIKDNGVGRWINRLVHRGTQTLAIALILLLGAIATEMLITALPAIQTFGFKFLWTREWNPVTDVYGIAPQIYGTLVTSLVAIALVLPTGVAIAILLTEALLPPIIRNALTVMIELLAAIPSVVYGLWGISILIPTLTPILETVHTRLGWLPIFSTMPSHRAMLPTILVLSLMMLPIVVSLARDALLSLPNDLRYGAAAVGANRWETLVYILLPASVSGITGATVLALGRAVGETMAAVMLIGNANKISLSLLAPGSTLAALIANQFPEARNLQVSALLYGALVLMGLTLLINIAATVLVNRGQSSSVAPIRKAVSSEVAKTTPGLAFNPAVPSEKAIDRSKLSPDSALFSHCQDQVSQWQPQRLQRRLLAWSLATGCGLALAIALLALASILVSLITQGHIRLDGQAFSHLPPPPLESGGGFRNALWGTLLMVGLATGLSAPLGVAIAIYLVEFSHKNRLSHWIRFSNSILSGIPSILCGLFAYSLVVLTTGKFSAVAGGIALAVLMVPITVRTAEEGLLATNPELRHGAIALGATNYQAIAAIILPAAAPSLITGVILAIARAMGETAPLLFTALFSQYGINGLWHPTASLSVLIYNFALSPYPNQRALAWTAALTLVILVLAISLTARWLLTKNTIRNVR